jgi:hypothetical protein
MSMQSEVLGTLRHQLRFELPFHEMMEEVRTQLHHNFFMEFFIIVAWEIWKQRNDFIFNRSFPSSQNWKRCFFQEAVLQPNRLQPDKHAIFLSTSDPLR